MNVYIKILTYGLTITAVYLNPNLCMWVVSIDLLRFLAGCRTKRLNQALSVLSLKLYSFTHVYGRVAPSLKF